MFNSFSVTLIEMNVLTRSAYRIEIEPTVQVEKSFVVGNGDVKITFLVKVNTKLATAFQVGKDSEGTRKIN